jgi:hypothetical protein
MVGLGPFGRAATVGGAATAGRGRPYRCSGGNRRPALARPWLRSAARAWPPGVAQGSGARSRKCQGRPSDAAPFCYAPFGCAPFGYAQGGQGRRGRQGEQSRSRSLPRPPLSALVRDRSLLCSCCARSKCDGLRTLSGGRLEPTGSSRTLVRVAHRDYPETPAMRNASCLGGQCAYATVPAECHTNGTRKEREGRLTERRRVNGRSVLTLGRLVFRQLPPAPPGPLRR